MEEFKMITEKFGTLKDKIETFERNFIIKTYFSDKKNDILQRCDDKIENLIMINSESVKIFTIDTRDKEFNVPEKQIRECPLKSILYNKFIDHSNTNDTIFIDIGSIYVKCALEVMRKLIYKEAAKSQKQIHAYEKTKLIVYEKDKINLDTLIDFLCYFFNQISKDNLESLVNFQYIRIPVNLSITQEEIYFINERVLERIIKQNNKEQKHLIKLLDNDMKEQFLEDGTNQEENFFSLFDNN